MLGGKGGIGIGRVNFSCCVVLLPHCLFLPSNRKKKDFSKEGCRFYIFTGRKILGGERPEENYCTYFQSLHYYLKPFLTGFKLS